MGLWKENEFQLFVSAARAPEHFCLRLLLFDSLRTLGSNLVVFQHRENLLQASEDEHARLVAVVQSHEFRSLPPLLKKN